MRRGRIANYGSVIIGKYVQTKSKHLRSYISINACLDDCFMCSDVVDYFNKIRRIIVILRSNQSFLVETIQLSENLINQLKLCDCLTDVQSRLLNRQTVSSDKRKLIGRSRKNSSDLLHVFRSCDKTRRSDCFRYLRHSSLKLVTRIIDNGGGLA